MSASVPPNLLAAADADVTAAAAERGSAAAASPRLGLRMRVAALCALLGFVISACLAVVAAHFSDSYVHRLIDEMLRVEGAYLRDRYASAGIVPRLLGILRVEHECRASFGELPRTLDVEQALLALVSTFFGVPLWLCCGDPDSIREGYRRQLKLIWAGLRAGAGVDPMPAQS